MGSMFLLKNNKKNIVHLFFLETLISTVLSLKVHYYIGIMFLLKMIKKLLIYPLMIIASTHLLLVTLALAIFDLAT